MRSVLESVNYCFHVVFTNAVLHNFLTSKLFRILQSRACRKHNIYVSRKADPNSESKAAALNIVKICEKKAGKSGAKKKK